MLDPQQNHQFVDNYLEVPIDLSKVLFICSANLLEAIPPTLRDRMELINLSGYTIQDKIAISQNYLIPHIQQETGLEKYNPQVPDSVLTYIINWYCRESGVRSLQRTLQRLHEKLVMRVVRHHQLNTPLDLDVTVDSLEGLLGPKKFTDSKRATNVPGLGVGLAYNSYGGNLMYIEVVNSTWQDKKGSLHVTG